MGTEQQGEQVTNEQAELDGYFEAWARTIVGHMYERIIANIHDPASADDTPLVDELKRELLDAWHHRAGKGAPPECVAFIAEHSYLHRNSLFQQMNEEAAHLKQERDALRLELAQVHQEQRQERETANRVRNEAFALQHKADELIKRIGTTIQPNRIVIPDEPPMTVAVEYRSFQRLLEREEALDNSYAMHEELQLLRANDRTLQVRELFDVVLPDQERLDKPGIPSDATVRFRLRLITEEYGELLCAVLRGEDGAIPIDLVAQYYEAMHAINSLIDQATVEVNLPEFIDALGDLDVVIEGARIAFGVDGRPIAQAIHAANMAKKDGPKRESDGKRLKPPGWKPADVAALLREQGWQGNG